MDCPMLRCPQCLETYNESRSPRNLSCGHSLCTPCTAKCLAYNKRCAECKEKQLVDRLLDIPVNYSLLRLIRDLTAEKVNLEDIKVPTYPFVDNPSLSEKQDLGNCSVHDSPLLFLCFSCSMWACEDCLVTAHPCLPRGNCRVLGLPEAMTQMKTEHVELANQYLRDIKTLINSFSFETAIQDYCFKHCPSELTHRRIQQRISSYIEDMKELNKGAVNQEIKHITTVSHTLNTTTSPVDLSSICHTLGEYQLKKLVEGERKRKLQVLQNVLRHLRMDLKILAKGNKPVYAVTQEEGIGTKWAHITIKEEHLLLYCLNEGLPPSDGINVPFDFVKERIPTEQTTIFFEVGTTAEVLGRVYIRIEVDNAQSQQIVLLCSGVKGVSYKGTCFFKYDDGLGELSGGDYENNDGTGGTSLVSGIEFNDDLRMDHHKAGTFSATVDSTVFHFLTKDHYTSIGCVIGKVVGGLDVLQLVLKLDPVSNAVITECGLFIPMEVKDPAD